MTDEKPVLVTVTRNMVRVMTDLLHHEEPVSRYALARRTGLGRQTVTNNVAILMKMGLVTVDGKGTVELTEPMKNGTVRALIGEFMDKLLPLVDFEHRVSGDTRDVLTAITNCLILLLAGKGKDGLPASAP